MTPVFQTRTGLEGNCMAAALASLLECELDQVDFVMSPDAPDSEWWLAMEAKLRELGYAYLEFPAGRWSPPAGLHYVAGGLSARGLPHAVIYLDGELAHDPHPDRTGLVRLDTAGFLVPFKPRIR